MGWYGIYPLVMTNSLRKLPIEFVDLPIKHSDFLFTSYKYWEKLLEIE